MYQIIFNELSAAEMAALPKELQLDLLAEFDMLPDDLDKLDPSKFGKLEREGRVAKHGETYRLGSSWLTH